MPKNNSMVAIRYATKSYKLAYQITERGGIRCVYLKDDPPQYLDAAQMWQWMKEAREAESPLYDQIVHAYMLLKKPSC